ncbi:MAG TPA: hypothetical protein VD816_13735 [Ohtaekwangia sp.]|nr:hypothetical protein [Ohtaekwangia sp.]
MHLLTQSGFALLTIVCFSLLLLQLKSALHAIPFTDDRKRRLFRGAVAAIVLWMIFTGALSVSGTLQNFSTFPPRIFLVLIIPLVAIIWILSVKVTGTILDNLSPAALIGLQVFRVFVEILLWALFTTNLLPVQMTFEGRNFDILAGLSAPLIAWLYAERRISRTVVIVWNFAGLALLINIVTIAILSMPTPIRLFMNEPANTIVTRFPFVWLPALLVPLAYGLHLLSLKQLFRRRD